MKKIFKIFLLIFVTFLTGCETNTLSKEKENYLNYVKEAHLIKESSEELPFDIEVKYDKLTKEEVRFQVIIDNPKEEIKNISAVAVHNKPTDDIFPSTGIFEEKQTLVPNKKPSGIILVGYIPYEKKLSTFKCNVKVLIKYSKDNKTNTVYYMTKKD